MEVSITTVDVYFNNTDYDAEKVLNTLNIIGKSKEEITSLIPNDLK